MQRALMQYFQPQYQAMAIKALKKAGREDLIGYDKHCLVAPMRMRPDGDAIGERPRGYRPERRPAGRSAGGDARRENRHERVERRDERRSQPKHGGNPARGEQRGGRSGGPERGGARGRRR